jgi:uncharacterized protein YjbI with pentapeptide repeats
MDLTGQILDGLDLSGANFNGAVLTNTSFVSNKLDGASFIEADLRDADLTSAIADKAEFLGAKLDGATLQGASLDGASLREEDLRNTDLGYTSVRGTRFSGSEFGEHTFSVDPKLHGEDFVCYDENTAWPDGVIPSGGYSSRASASECSNDSFCCKVHCVGMPGHGKPRQVSVVRSASSGPCKCPSMPAHSTILLKSFACVL